MRSGVVLAFALGCGSHGATRADSGIADTLDAPAPRDGPAVDAPVAVDASSPDAFVPPQPATCGAPQALPDDFGTVGELFGAADWARTNASAAGSTVTLTGNASVYAWASVSLISAAATVEVRRTMGSAGVTSFVAEWPDGSGYDRVGIDAIGSNLEVGSWSADGSSSTTTVAFDGSAMAFWQISESAGTVAFATSPDGSGWSAPISTVPTPPWAPYAHLALETTGSAAGSAVFTALDGSAAGSAMPWCDTDTLHSEPGSDNIATWWGNTEASTDCTFGGSGEVTGTSSGCVFQTSSRYNLVDSSFVVHWGSDTQGAAEPLIGFFGTTRLPGYVNYNGSGELCDSPAGSCVAHTFSPGGADAYWRIAELSATHEIEVSISPDGVAWAPLLLYPEPFVPSGVEIVVGTLAAGSAHVLGVN